MNLYEISESIDRVMQMVDEDGVLLPEAEEAFEQLTMDKEEKFRNIAGLIKNLSSDAEQCKEEAAKLGLKKKMAENKAERLKAYLKFVMDKSGQKKYKAGIFSFTIQEFKSIAVENPETLPEEFKKVTVEAKKTELKEAMTLGQKFEGVSVQKNKSLVIR